LAQERPGVSAMAEVPVVLVLRGRVFGRADAKVGTARSVPDGLDVCEGPKGRPLYSLRWRSCSGVTFAGENVFLTRRWPHRNCEFYAQEGKHLEMRRLFAPLSDEALTDPPGADFGALAKLLATQMVYAETRGSTPGRSGSTRSETPFAAKIRHARMRAGVTPSTGGDLSARSSRLSSGCSTPVAPGSVSESPSVPLPGPLPGPSLVFNESPRLPGGLDERRYPTPRAAMVSGAATSPLLTRTPSKRSLPAPVTLPSQYATWPERQERSLATVPSVETIEQSPPTSVNQPLPPAAHSSYIATGSKALSPPQDAAPPKHAPGTVPRVPPLPLHSLAPEDDMPMVTVKVLPPSEAMSPRSARPLRSSCSTPHAFLDEQALTRHTAATAVESDPLSRTVNRLSSDEAYAALRRAASFAPRLRVP